MQLARTVWSVFVGCGRNFQRMGDRGVVSHRNLWERQFGQALEV